MQRQEAAGPAAVTGTEPAHEGGACLHGHQACAPAPAGSKDAHGHFGATFALQNSRPLADVLREFDTVQAGTTVSNTVLVEGTIGQVCQRRGCWLQLQDGEARVRVIMKDGKFSVPIQSQGKRAQVEGDLVVRQLSTAQLQHLAMDAGEDPKTITQPRNEYVLTAFGVDIQ